MRRVQTAYGMDSRPNISCGFRPAFRKQTHASSCGRVIPDSLPYDSTPIRADCLEDTEPKDIQTDLENGQSTGSLITFGKFRTIDLGDLLWNVEGDLMCPTNQIGTVDLYLTTHHGLDWSNSKQVIYALQPRVAIMNNGTRKGGQVEVYQTLEASPGLENLWQLHWSYNGMLEHNVASQFIANIDSQVQLAAVVANPPAPNTSVVGPPPARGAKPVPAPAPAPPNYPNGPQGNAAHSPAYWIEVSAQSDGTFTITNSRNGFSKTYRARS